MHYVFSGKSEFDKQEGQHRHHDTATANTEKAGEDARKSAEQQKREEFKDIQDRPNRKQKNERLVYWIALLSATLPTESLLRHSLARKRLLPCAARAAHKD